MGMNLLIKASGKESRGAIMESGIRQPPIRGFMDDQTITTPSHVQARWILKALDVDSYPYHQWLKSLRWHSAKLWWCTETPAMKRSEMQTSSQDQDASGQLTHQWHRLRACWSWRTSSGTRAWGDKDSGKTTSNNVKKQTQGRGEIWYKKGEGQRPWNLDHKEPGLSETCQREKSHGLNFGD